MADGVERLGITGASGRLAGLIVEQLLDVREVEPDRLVALSRSPDGLDALARRGVDVRHADFDARDGLVEAFAGIDRLLIISTDDIFPIGTRARQQTAAVTAAAQAGVQHLVYTSAPNPEPDSPMFWTGDHFHTEQAIRSSGCGWTFLRNSEYAEIHLERHWPDAIAAGEIHTIAGDGGCAYVSRDDCAAAAAAALDSASTENRTLDITGPEALSVDAAMDVIAAFTGRPIDVIHTTADAYEDVLRAGGQPDWLIPCWVGLEEGIAQGSLAEVSDGFTRLTGRPSTPFRAVVEACLGPDGAGR